MQCIPDEAIAISKPLIKILEFVSERQTKDNKNGLSQELKESLEKINFQMFGPVIQVETSEEKLPEIVKNHSNSRNTMLNPIVKTSIDLKGHKTMKVSPTLSPNKEVKSPKQPRRLSRLNQKSSGDLDIPV